MSVVLSENLPLLASAPGGIQKLRGLILELAVRGKLVPQDPSDEPASELLKWIATERARLEAEGVCKKSKPLPQVGKDEQPFAIPNGWLWVRLAGIASFENGDRSKNYPSRDEFVPSGIPFINAGHLLNRRVNFAEMNFIPQVRFDALRAGKTRKGDLLFCLRGSLGKFGVVVDDAPAAIASSLVIIRLYEEKLLKYVESYFSSPIIAGQIAKFDNGTAQPNLGAADLTKFVFPLPPLGEQHRIVTKVDELMALCDKLEAEQADATSAHVRLVETLLGTLCQSTDAADLTANWQRLAEHFDILFETPSAVAALRKTILNLAVAGRLVRQSMPAETYALSTLIEGNSLNGCSKRPSDTPCGVQILRISAGTGNDDFFIDENDHKWVEATPAEIDKFRLLPDDLLACRFNGNLHYVGSFSLYRGQSAAPQIFPDKLIRFRVQKNKVLANYLRYALNADSVRVQVESFCATTVGNIGISAGNLKTVQVRVPELDEQHRIVAKVDELMALCDSLKVDLATAPQHQVLLADTLIESALEAA